MYLSRECVSAVRQIVDVVKKNAQTSLYSCAAVLCVASWLPHAPRSFSLAPATLVPVQPLPAIIHAEMPSLLGSFYVSRTYFYIFFM